MPSQEEIYTKVSATLVEALNVDEDDIKPTSTLQGDLGAESIDFLDIVFRLEREFRLRIPRGELFPEPIPPDDPTYMRDGLVTDEYLSTLRSRMPYADLGKLDRDRRLSLIDDLLTVGLLMDYVRWQLGSGGPAECVIRASASSNGVRA